jgi:peptide/nickel transport system substrate-binding protein
MLSMPYCSVVPHEVTDALGRDFGRHPVGTGPFRFHEWHEQVKLVLHRNPYYFERDGEGERLPYLLRHCHCPPAAAAAGPRLNDRP